MYVATIILPLASNGPLIARAQDNNGDLREEIGWNELVKTVAQIRDSFPPQEQPRVGIVVGNYGEQGAIEILGPVYHLPPPISGTNSAWYRRYPTSPPPTLIVVGHSREYVDKTFTSCRLVAHNTNPYAIHNEESDDHPDIFLSVPHACRGLSSGRTTSRSAEIMAFRLRSNQTVDRQLTLNPLCAQ